MTPQEIQELKKLMETTVEELSGSVDYLKDITQPIEPSVSLGRLTRMEAIGEKGVNEARLAEVQRRLERLRNALKRVEDGSYGKCIRCSKDIPFGRLKAVPESLLCVPCAEKKR